MNDPKHIIEKAKAIHLLICDVDGVLSDGRISLDEQQNEYKAFHAHDGLGLQLLKNAEIQIAVISSRKAQSVQQRMQHWSQHIYQGVKDKLACYQQLKQQLNLSDQQIAYIGDDLPDLPVLRQVGLAITVADARPPLTDHCHWQTRCKGGKGAVREVCELILQAQGKWQQQLATFL